MNWLENWPTEVVRAKGFFWLASRNEEVGLLSQAGMNVTISGAGNWVATYPLEERESLLREDEKLRQTWDHQYGDRLTELVLIGVSMSQEQIASSLQECVLTDAEMRSDWQILVDPLPLFTEEY
ncbi:GTPase [Bacillus sp. TS-2]|nr:GTPase [Bacillus sp. TS-2]